MKNKKALFGILGLVLVFSLVITGCQQPLDNNYNGDDPYVAKWEAIAGSTRIIDLGATGRMVIVAQQDNGRFIGQIDPYDTNHRLHAIVIDTSNTVVTEFAMTVEEHYNEDLADDHQVFVLKPDYHNGDHHLIVIHHDGTKFKLHGNIHHEDGTIIHFGEFNTLDKVFNSHEALKTKVDGIKAAIEEVPNVLSNISNELGKFTTGIFKDYFNKYSGVSNVKTESDFKVDDWYIKVGKYFNSDEWDTLTIGSTAFKQKDDVIIGVGQNSFVHIPAYRIKDGDLEVVGVVLSAESKDGAVAIENIGKVKVLGGDTGYLAHNLVIRDFWKSDESLGATFDPVTNTVTEARNNGKAYVGVIAVDANGKDLLNDGEDPTPAFEKVEIKNGGPENKGGAYIYFYYNILNVISKAPWNMYTTSAYNYYQDGDITQVRSMTKQHTFIIHGYGILKWTHICNERVGP